MESSEQGKKQVDDHTALAGWLGRQLRLAQRLLESHSVALLGCSLTSKLIYEIANRSAKVFETIGIIAVIVIAYLFIRGFARSSSDNIPSVERNLQTGHEARTIATEEYGVPLAYYNHSVINHMDRVKKCALEMQELSPQHRNYTWPRLLASAVQFAFQNDCDLHRKGNTRSVQRFRELAITEDVIATTLAKREQA